MRDAVIVACCLCSITAVMLGRVDYATLFVAWMAVLKLDARKP